MTSRNLLAVTVFLATIGLASEVSTQTRLATSPVFSDDFEDGDISDWTTVAAGDGDVAAEQYPGPDWSLNIYSPQSAGTKAQAISPLFTLDEAKDYNVSLEFAFESPAHWIEVFRSQHINAVLDDHAGGNDWRFKCRYGGSNHLIMVLNPYASYNIEFRVHPGSSTYDVYVGGSLRETCDFDPGGPSFPQFRLGDFETGTSNYGTAMYDDIAIVEEEAAPIPTVSEWGAPVMALLVLVAGTLALAWRSTDAPKELA